MCVWVPPLWTLPGHEHFIWTQKSKSKSTQKYKSKIESKSYKYLVRSEIPLFERIETEKNWSE